MNKKYFLAITIFLSLVFMLFSEKNSSDPDKLITDIYLKNGVHQFTTGNYEEALYLSTITLSFDKESSDAIFIKALSNRYLKIKSTTITDLSEAIINNKWIYYNEITGRVYLSKYMYFDGRNEDAYLNLLPFINDLTKDSYSTEIFIRIALSLGKVDEAVQSAKNLLRNQAYDSYAQLILLLYDEQWRLEASQILEQGDPSEIFSKEVLQAFMQINTECGYLNELYFKRWGDDRFYKISNVCSNIETLPDLLDELYPENIVVNFDEFIRINELIKNENNILNLLKDKLNSINFEIEYDSDLNGFIDTKSFFSMGQLKSFSYDKNQDNNFDYFIDINDYPVSLKIVTMNDVSTFIYQEYPDLIQVVYSSNKLKVDYQLIPYKLTFDVISLPINILQDIPRVLRDVTLPDNKILTDFSAKKTSTDKENNYISNYSIMGTEESIDETYNSDGVKIVERKYRNSILISVYKDFDSDGVFDTKYDYKDGILLTISFDENNNGISEYIENHEEELVRSWDFNEDGIIDSIEYYKNEILYRELSSKLDGVFDTILEIKSDMK
jgi:hypothetical protein